MSEPPKAQLPLSDPRPSDVAVAAAAMAGTGRRRPARTGGRTAPDGDPDRDAAELFAALDSDDVWRHVRGRPSTVAEQAASAARPDRGRASSPSRSGCASPTGDSPPAPSPARAATSTSSTSDGRLEIGFTAYTRPLWGSVRQSGREAGPAAVRIRRARGRAGAAQDRHSQFAIAAGDRPPRCRLRRAATPVSTASGRHDPRHRGLLDHRRGVADRSGRAAGARR